MELTTAMPRILDLPPRTPGHTLPQAYYTDPDIFGEDLRRVFWRNWLFAGHACDLREPGDFFTFDIGTESLLVVRDAGGAIRAHFNVCRHRGSRIEGQERGHAKALVCPYHQWVFSLDGCLSSARLMGESFDKSQFGLRPAAVRELAGLVFVCLSPDPPPFDPAVEAIGPQLRPHGLDDAKVAARFSYDVRANWKLLVENNRECYHCRGGHPEFCLSNFDLGMNGDPRVSASYAATLRREYDRWRALGLSPAEVSFPGGSFYRVVRLPLKDGFLTESLDGRPVAPLLGDLPTAGTGSLRVITLPNSWSHANCDYAVTTRLTPVGPEMTRIDLAFLVRADAVEGVDFDLGRVTDVWKATSEQDWELCENNHAGVRSMAYTPGPYSTVTENSVDAFVHWYTEQLGIRDEQHV
ncbi:aromatic ring-hydroxylating dioxygenase subunit alpha [soil metagenome]|jgi:Rieske 2Fe-2S family protein|nr:aromatic ring-hydroxylating dioxygenase subunit alpha [Euzebyaceae bacterium]